MNRTKTRDKSNFLSAQVKEILFKKGFSFLFTDRDFLYYKKQTKNAINRPYAIAELFISDNHQQSDFADYEY